MPVVEQKKLGEVSVKEESAEVVAEFIRHLNEAAARRRLSPAKYLLSPENRQELGLAVSEPSRFLVQRRAKEIAPAVPIRFVENQPALFGVPDTGTGKIIESERIWTGWEVDGREIQPMSTPTSPDWEVGLEPIKVSVPKVVREKRIDSNRGLRQVGLWEVASQTGLTEVQFSIQPILGKSQAVTEGVLEAIPVLMRERETWGGGAWDPMLLRFNHAKLQGRRGNYGDVMSSTESMLNGLSGQAVHFGVQALMEGGMTAYLANKLRGEVAFPDEWQKAAISLLTKSAYLAVTAYESLITQAIGWSEVGVNLLTPREFAFAAEATGSYFDGVKVTGEFIARDSGRLINLMNAFRADLSTLGWKGK